MTKPETENGQSADLLQTSSRRVPPEQVFVRKDGSDADDQQCGAGQTSAGGALAYMIFRPHW